MKATYVREYGDADVLEYGDWENPTPVADQVLIAVKAIPVNYADIHARTGRYGRTQQPPFIPGLESVGTILAVGEQVSEFQVGQRVVAFSVDGSYSERMLARSVLTYALPDAVSDEDAACCVSAITAYNILTLAGQLSPDDIVVIHSAAGGVGTFAVQIAKVLNAHHIIATVGSDEKIELVRRLGADTVVNYRQGDFTDTVHEISEGKGATLILEARGGDRLSSDLQCLAHFGRMVVYGRTSGESMQLDTGVMYKRNQSVIGYSSGHYRNHRPEVLRPGMAKLLEMFASGTIRNIVGGKFSLEEAASAHRLLESRQSTGKILLNV
jgi:NADPH2:quinone reductase